MRATEPAGRPSMHGNFQRAAALFGASWLAFGIVSCGELGEDDLGTGDLGTVEVVPGAKEDSPSRPTAMGELRLKTPQTHALTRGRGGYHAYTFAGRSGWKITFTEKSAAFRTYLRVYAPSGRRWSAPGVRAGAAWVSTLGLDLPETGTYRVLVT